MTKTNLRSSAGLPDYDDAIKSIMQVSPPPYQKTIRQDDARGFTLAQAVICDRDQPPYERSAMDGYAIICPEKPVKLSHNDSFELMDDLPAGHDPTQLNQISEQRNKVALKIATGSSVPAPFNAVIPREFARQVEDAVTFDMAIKPWQNIHRQASDAQEGAEVLSNGMRLKPHHVGILAALGYHEILVHRKPRVAILTTGDEVYPLDTKTEDLPPYAIRNSNGSMIRELVLQFGGDVVYQAHVKDEPEYVRVAAREALSHAQLVVTTGGISAGDKDYLPWAWQQLGLNKVIHGACIQPGKPIFAASDAGQQVDQSTQVDAVDQAEKLVIGLPGNPVSAFTTAYLFLWPVLKIMQGQSGQLPWISMRTGEAMKCKSARQLFRAAILDVQGESDDRQVARLLPWQGSGDLLHTIHADGFLRLPKQAETLESGSIVPFLPISSHD